jgi:AcrR family transcriptional regulator
MSRAVHTRSAESRDRILAAAAAEFATHGFAGGGVDRIARRARLNKAMIYYHFHSKAGLYHELLRDMFRATAVRVEEIAGGDLHPEDKIRRFVAAFADEAARRPHIPPIMLRELAEKGQHLDPETLGLLRRVPRAFEGIVAEGVRNGTFSDESPFLTYSTIVGPLMFFLASAPVRTRLEKLGAGLHAPEIGSLVAHLQDVVMIALTRDAPGRGRSRRARQTAAPRRAGSSAARRTRAT